MNKNSKKIALALNALGGLILCYMVAVKSLSDTSQGVLCIIGFILICSSAYLLWND